MFKPPDLENYFRRQILGPPLLIALGVLIGLAIVLAVYLTR